jgi:DNA-binding IclR family transcriptional regulator
MRRFVRCVNAVSHRETVIDFASSCSYAGRALAVTSTSSGLRESSRGPRYRLQVLDRAVHILDVLVRAGVELGPSEIGAALSLHKSTIHRLLAVLERHRLVLRNPHHGKYTVGSKVLELANGSIAHIEMRTRAMPTLRRLVDQTAETAHVAVLDGTEMLSIANVEGPWTLRLRSAVGRRTPVYCTAVGKSVIASLPESELKDLLRRIGMKRFTNRTIVTPAGLKRELAKVRASGYAADNGELEPGVRCIAAPVRDVTGRVAGAISASGPMFRVTRERVPAIARAVIAAARELSLAMGYAGD